MFQEQVLSLSMQLPQNEHLLRIGWQIAWDERGISKRQAENEVKMKLLKYLKSHDPYVPK